MDVIGVFSSSDLGGGDAVGGIINEDGICLMTLWVEVVVILNTEDWKSKDMYLRVESSGVGDFIPVPLAISLELSDEEVKSRVAVIQLGESFHNRGPLGTSPSST
eukprot:13855499-Ditylum_brightwellii.AAC.1